MHLLTTKHETGGIRTWDIPFDSELSEVTISITGENRRVKIFDPNGREYTRGNVFINNNETYVVVIKNPQPNGSWRVEASSGSAHSLRHGFLSHMT